MKCEHNDYEVVGKFPKSMYIHEAGGDEDRLANDIKCQVCNKIGREEYYWNGYEIEHKDTCEELDSAVDDVGVFPNNIKVKHDYFYNKIKCGDCKAYGISVYYFENRIFEE